MTRLLEKAFSEAGKLSATEQDKVAQWLLDELASERQWDEVFSNSSDALKQLADEALSELHEGVPRLKTNAQNYFNSLA